MSTTLYVLKCIEIIGNRAIWKYDSDSSEFTSEISSRFIVSKLQVGQVYKGELWTGGTFVPLAILPNYRAERVRIRLRLVSAA